ncbi:MAG TPA: hypothetical protein VFO34_15650 [Candidatus Acidoferrales bacterium]|nr:hypothetical protein [Candidatus Acidoferrales bacterium]
MFRILLANFIVEYVPLALAVCGILLLARKSSRAVAWKRYVGIACISLPVGVLVYIIASMIAAPLEGGGHFYSVPFGGYDPGANAAILTSAVLWIALVFGVLAFAFRARK